MSLSHRRYALDAYAFSALMAGRYTEDRVRYMREARDEKLVEVRKILVSAARDAHRMYLIHLDRALRLQRKSLERAA